MRCFLSDWFTVAEERRKKQEEEEERARKEKAEKGLYEYFNEKNNIPENLLSPVVQTLTLPRCLRLCNRRCECCLVGVEVGTDLKSVQTLVIPLIFL